tara:strand:+ start:2352 stop:3194 length:843 start_codon:yes stop_codon:yes gene_type:complete
LGKYEETIKAKKELIMKFIICLAAIILISGLYHVADAATGFEYLPDEHTIGLWHFNEGSGATVKDESQNNLKGVIEGKAVWGQDDWNEEGGGKSVEFGNNTSIVIGGIKDKRANKLLTPDDAITVEAWVYPTDLASWKLICCHWAGAVGKYHLGVTNGIPNMHVNTDKGTANAASALALGVKEWYHVAGTYDGKEIKIYINGKLEGSAPHKGKMATGSPWDVMVGTKASREFFWHGFIDEVRVSSIAREAEELSANFDGPQAVKLNPSSLPVHWGELKKK